MDLTRWRGRVALVTGASSGIGRAVAERLAAEGMRVVVCGRRRGLLLDLAERLGARGADVLPVAVDLRREGDIAALFARVRAEWGGVDVLVNNAGLGRHAPLVDGETEAWREILELNVLALCVCTREALHDMRRRGDDGHVVHVSSMAAYRVPPQSGVYAASKYAVRALTEGLRAELRALGSRIRVSSVSPGYTETEFASVYHRDPERARRTYAQFKVLAAEDVAEAVAYLLGQPPHVQVHDVQLRSTEQPT
jgi:NADP-dependent 3-hydroxy acid dehydrogenase YdfG